MRRIPSWAYLVLPLALGLLYAVAYPLVAPRPTLESVVPQAAVVTARYRGLAQLDALWCFGRAADLHPSEDLAERHNLPGLPGVDRSGHVHWVLLPLSGRSDPTLLILPVSDADALEDRFLLRDGPQDPARLLRRHAKHLEQRGDYAALAWDREAARQLGTGGLTLEDRGEDFGLAIDVRGAIELAFAQAGTPPWRGLLEALGAEPSRAVAGVDAQTGRRGLVFPFGRAPRVAEAWSSARLWAYAERREIEIELVPATEALRLALQPVLQQGAASPRLAVPVPVGPAAWCFVPNGAALSALQAVLTAAGVDLPEAASPAPAGALELRAYDNLGDARSWTLAVHAPEGFPSAVESLLGPLPGAGELRPLDAGAAPLTLSSTQRAGTSPAGHVARSADGSWLFVGADAEGKARGQAPGPGEPTVLLDGGPGALLACGWLSAERALSLLGPALQSGGVFSALGLGNLRVVVTTDGRLVRVRLTRLP